jgi:hypothetical protein
VREGIARGSEDGDQRSDRQAQQGAATDARAVGEDIPEFNRAAEREVLTAFNGDSQTSEGSQLCASLQSSLLVTMAARRAST